MIPRMVRKIKPCCITYFFPLFGFFYYYCLFIGLLKRGFREGLNMKKLLLLILSPILYLSSKLILFILTLINSLGSLVFRNRFNKRIEKTIKDVYKTTNIPWDSSDIGSSELHRTNIHWEDFEKFAEKYDGEADLRPNGDISTEFNIDLNISGLYEEDIHSSFFEKSFRVTGVRSRLDGTTTIQVADKNYL